MKNYHDLYTVVTGGAGFIGSAVIRQLNQQGVDNIIVVDDLGESDKWKNLVGKKFTDIITKFDLFDWLEERETEVGTIIHLGACSSTVEKNAGYLLENNYRYSTHLAEYALENNLRFIYASSAATYGNGSQGFSDDHDQLEALEPLNMYGYSKHLFDLWLKNQGVLDDVVGLKYFNVFGPNEYHKGRMASTVLHFVPIAQRGESIRLFKSNDSQYGDGEQMRDFIYVKDVAKMTCAFLDNDAGGIFNIGTGKPQTWNQLAKSVFDGLQKPAKIEYIDLPEDLKGKYQNYTSADMKKTQSVLGESCQTTPFEVAVEEYVKDYLVPQKTW